MVVSDVAPKSRSRSRQSSRGRSGHPLPAGDQDRAKELLPVVDTPGIELVAAEAAEAGAERLVIITSEGKDSVVAHFVEDLVLEGTLEARGKVAMLAKVRRARH